MQPPGARAVAGPSNPAMMYQPQQPLHYLGPEYASQAYGSYTQTQPQHLEAYGQSPYPHSYVGYQNSQQYFSKPESFYYYTDLCGRPVGSPISYQFTNVPYPRAMASDQSSYFQSPSWSQSLYGGQNQAQDQGDNLSVRQQTSQESSAIVLRGPPRIPKQSGHALWVGNLPPNASIGALKDHFSRDFTRQIESLYLISKSRCAFVNYRTDNSCAKAMQTFHESWFEGVRLVCRRRNNPDATAGAPIGPAGIRMRSSSTLRTVAPDSDKLDDAEPNEPGVKDAAEFSEPLPATSKDSERYFIVKSLTLQDLEQSVRSGTWATQVHNEEALNNAFTSAETVYLIFSANKSGEYFGYARMTSTIADNTFETLDTIERTINTAEPTFAPRTTATSATGYAPRGHVVDDFARGTIFWEAELTDDEDDIASESSKTEAEPPTWGKPFRVEWLSTTRVPFYWTRGLRNAWNANRLVKVARDGTELETMVGRQLLQLFHQPQAPQKSMIPGETCSRRDELPGSPRENGGENGSQEKWASQENIPRREWFPRVCSQEKMAPRSISV